MSWKRYEKYQDSGVEWLGEVPEEWNVNRMKYLCNINPTKSEISHLSDDLEVSFLPMEKINEDHTLTLDKNQKLSEVWNGYTYFRDNDVILAKITPCFENGKCCLCSGLTNKIGFGTTELHVLRPKSKILSRFCFYLLQSHSFRGIGKELMFGTAGQKRLPEDFIADYKQGIPSLPEQTAIAAFLDRETTRIDALIEKKERLIALLEEKRAALISHAVTKGLDPSVPMKDSGVDWIGMVPEGRDVMKIRRCTHLQQGLQIPQSDRFSEPSENRLEYITLQSIHAGKNNPNIEYIENPPIRVICYPEDILFVRTGATGEIVTGVYGAFHNNFFKVIYDQNNITKEYLIMYLSNSLIRQYLLLMAGVTTIPDLNHDEFLDAPLILPPIYEQDDIVKYLSKIIRISNNLINKIDNSLEYLKEYRSALISAAVTGKIDLRQEAMG